MNFNIHTPVAFRGTFATNLDSYLNESRQLTHKSPAAKENIRNLTRKLDRFVREELPERASVELTFRDESCNFNAKPMVHLSVKSIQETEENGERKFHDKGLGASYDLYADCGWYPLRKIMKAATDCFEKK